MEEERKKYLFRFSVVILLCGLSFSFCLASLACNQKRTPSLLSISISFLSSSIFNTSFNLSAYPHYFVPLQCQTKIVCRQNLMTSYIYCTAYELRCIRSGLTVSPKKQTSGVQDLEQSSQFREMTKGSEGTLSNV